MIETDIELLKGIANKLRIHSINATTAAGSGHPTSCCSMADLMAALFFGHMRYDAKNPKHHNNDRFILSKGHAAPILYAAWAEAGFFPTEELLKLRQIDSDLEGHPTPRLAFADVATGSLGQGLGVGVGVALAARLDKLDYNTYVLLGDGEIAEGAVWEAASLAGIQRLNNLVAIVDMNRLGQSQATAFGHDADLYRERFESFGWRVEDVDGHDIEEILEVLGGVGLNQQPLAIIAKTYKGAGVSFLQDKDGWHGKTLNAEEAAKAVAELQPSSKSAAGVAIPAPSALPAPNNAAPASYPGINYNMGDLIATREAYGAALLRIGEANRAVVAMDGDTKNSTYSERFFKKFPERFTECFIAEQNLVAVAIGFGTRGKVPFASTFATFFTRAFDQIRVAGISSANLKLVGSHVGVSIGEDGPSQMALEDLAMMRAVSGSVVFYPSDAVSTEKLLETMAQTRGLFFMRTSRPKTPVIYSNEDKFPIGGAKIVRQNDGDKVTVVGAGVTLHEAIKAADLLAQEGIGITVVDAYCIKPLGKAAIKAAAARTNNIVVTVEDHYAEGGLGDAVAGELSCDGVKVHKLAVRELPRSGKAEELLAKFGIDAAEIVKKVKALVAA
ncbi:MAG: transketolase [Verrucomicrobiota bacterium]